MKCIPKLSSVLLIPFFFAFLTDAVAHTPSFSWRVRGDANYEQWIYDGDEPIAMLDMKSLDEPMQALMMFRLVPKPLLLRYLKLEPGGKPLVSAVQLYWKTGTVITDVLDGLDIKGEGTGRLTVTFTVKDPWDTIKVVRTLTVTYDNSIGSYIYDFSDIADILKPETLDTNKPVRIEYCDPWFTDCPAPSQRFSGMWTGRYRQFAYESADGGIVSIPHHHVSCPQKGGIRLRRDGVFAAVYEPDGNPAIRFMGETADKTSIGICPWAYDVHFGYTAEPEELYRPIRMHFRFFKCPDDRAKELNNSAKIPVLEKTSWGGLVEFPLYEPHSSFDKTLSVNAVRQGDIDPWFWRPEGEDGAVWDKTSGRNDSHSLKIGKNTDGLTEWTSMCEGQGYFTAPWSPCKGYEVSCQVKTENVTGAGASIGFLYHVPNVPPEWPVIRSERITGTNGWTKLTVRVGPPPEGTSIISLHLSQAGSGTTWFDDLEVTMLK